MVIINKLEIILRRIPYYYYLTLTLLNEYRYGEVEKDVYLETAAFSYFHMDHRLMNREFSDVDMCASCKLRQDDVKNLKREAFWTNRESSCMHQFCNDCKERHFRTKKEFSCPICNNIVYNRNLVQQSRDSIEVEEDTKVRRRIKLIFNKVELDFESAEEYRQYEEDVETLIFDLLYGDKATKEDAEVRIEKYKSENEILIKRNQQKRDVNISMFMARAAGLVTGMSDTPHNEHIKGGGASARDRPDNFVGSSNILLEFLKLREDPKPLRFQVHADKHSDMARLAGGYIEKTLSRRNWAELTGSLGFV